MLIRIVRMHFAPEAVPIFLRDIWAVHKASIAAQPGCLSVALKADATDATVYYTLSHWASQAALDAYRQSTLFAQVWPATKALFAQKAQAYSLLDVGQEDVA